MGAIYGLKDDGVYNYSDFVEFDGLTDAEAAELLYSNVTGTENWYSVNIYNLKEGVVRNSLVQDGTYRPGMTKFKDQLTVDTDGDGIADATDGIINDEDRHIIGNTLPIHIGVLVTILNIKILIFLSRRNGPMAMISIIRISKKGLTPQIHGITSSQLSMRDGRQRTLLTL